MTRYNKNRNKDKNKDIQYVTLPYDFIPFSEKWIPYNIDTDSNNLPRHDLAKLLNGYIKYKLIPQSDLAVEIKKGESDRLFLSGSQIRGIIRRNAEILSQNYPHFINGNSILYRDISSDEYKNKLNVINGIEKSVEVGFLRKDGENFYVVPAEKWSSYKNFISIKEHKIVNIGRAINGGKSMLYSIEGSQGKFAEINKFQKQIDKLTNEINQLREELKDELDHIQEKINYIFIGKYSFNKKLKNIVKRSGFDGELENIGRDLLKELNKLNNSNKKLNVFFSKMVDRWKYKAKIHNIYSGMKPNKEFMPYQKEVFYKENGNCGIDKISFDSNNGKFVLKGYLFNSTNASSKRSHYFIKKEGQLSEYITVPQNVIEGYRQNLKKFCENSKENETKWFYDIFDDENYKKLIKENPEGLIVFFKTEKAGKAVEMIGRTPYFKVPYNHSIKDIIEKGGESTIGYADALFGFTSDVIKKQENEKDTLDSYKSRLWFTAVDIKGKFQESDYVPIDFLLPSPFASANAMYLEQSQEKELSTYNDDKAKLNGYKYYHILDKVQESKKEPKSRLTTKGVIKNNNNYFLEGKVHFKNLAPEELGLLLLSLDIKEILNSKKYKDFIENPQIDIENNFEQIGGAKPYGYGKIQIEVTELLFEKNGISFESLIIDSIEKQKNKGQYIDAYITKINEIHNVDYFSYLKRYIESKQKKNRTESLNNNYSINNSMAINWYNLQEKIKNNSGKNGGGYPKNWRIIK